MIFLGTLKKRAKMELPRGGVDMQSDHACACFVRVGRRRRGSILGSIFEQFWKPSRPLYSFLVALDAKTGLQKVDLKKLCFRGTMGTSDCAHGRAQDSLGHGLARG